MSAALSQAPMLAHEPAHWREADRRPLRGCCICNHGLASDGVTPSRRDKGGAVWCQHPAVAGQRGRIPIADARANHGPCGPEARHQNYPGLAW